MNDLTDMYGNAISPYKLDLTLLLSGISRLSLPPE